MIDLSAASLFPMLPISQAPDASVAIKPSITVISEHEFLILSWTGASTIGVFITGDGDPVRGTLEWSSHPEAVHCCWEQSHRCQVRAERTELATEERGVSVAAVREVVGSAQRKSVG